MRYLYIAIFSLCTLLLPAQNICSCGNNSGYGDTVFTLNNGTQIKLCGFATKESLPKAYFQFILLVCLKDSTFSINTWQDDGICNVWTSADTLFIKNTFTKEIFKYNHEGKLIKPRGLSIGLQPDSYEVVPDNVFKKELSCFYYVGALKENCKGLILDAIPTKMCNDTMVQFEGYDYKIIIRAAQLNFANNESQFKARFTENRDGEKLWGTDGNLPNQKIQSIDVYKNNFPFTIPKESLKNLFEPNLCYKNKPTSLCNVYISKDKKRLYIYMLNGDGAGGYNVAFIFDNDTYKQRVIDLGF